MIAAGLLIRRTSIDRYFAKTGQRFFDDVSRSCSSLGPVLHELHR